MKAAIYARYSSDNQREESISAQIRACSDYCRRKNYDVAQEYTDEALSARSDERPAFQNMIDDAKAGLFDVLICHKIDRFSRDRYDDAFYKRQLNKAGVTVEFCEQNIDGSPESIILESVLVGMAEYYSKNLAREVMKGMRETAYQAKHNGGTPPLGYDVNKDGDYIVNEKEAAAVRLIFGRKADGVGYGPIIDELNSRGYRTKRGGRFGKNSIHDILKNKKYIGTYVFGRVSGGRSTRRNNHKDSGEVIEIAGAIPPIVDMGIWEKVQKKIKDAKHAPGKTKARETYYLSGKIRCAECGGAMVGGTFVSKGSRYSYYRCANYKQKRNCSGVQIKKEMLEKVVLDHVDTKILDRKMIPLVMQEIDRRLKELTSSGTKEIKAAEKQKTDALRKIDNLLSLAEDGQVDDFVKTRIAENKALIADADAKIKKIQAAIGAMLTPEQVVSVLDQFATMEKGPEEIKAIIETFVDYVIVSKDDIDIQLSLSFEWWRRGESNPCPKALLHKFLRAQSEI